MNTGVYKIHNKINNKVYIGSAAKSFNLRKNVHFSNLRNNKHKNIYLQNSFNKYGEENIRFQIIEECDPLVCVEREQYWIDYYKSYLPEFGYNIRRNAASILGHKFDKEIGRKRGLKLKGRIISEEHRKKIGIGNLGKKLSEETKRKISEANKGKKVVISESQKKKISLSNLGKISKFRKPVLMYNLNNEFIREYVSLSHAAKDININKWKYVTSIIMNICKGKQKTLYKKYKFKYKENE